MTPAEAIAMAPAGVDEDEVRRFVTDEYPKVVAGVAMITGDRSSAEDMVQDAMVKAWQRRDEIQNLAAWITVVASNAAKSGLRKKANERKATDKLEARLATMQTSAATGVADRLTLADAIELLPERQRQMVVLYYYLGYPVAEVATVLGVADGTVKTSLHRARQALGTLLGEPEDHADTEEGSSDGR